MLPRLDFHAAMAHQLVPALSEEQSSDDASDGLIVAANGLGVNANVVAPLLKAHATQRNLVLVLSCTSSDDGSGLVAALPVGISNPETEHVSRDGNMEAFVHSIVASETQKDKRARLYKNGGVVQVSSRILVVDFLNGVVPIQLVTGVIVLHAERITETSTEAFILRLLREKNKVAFIRAFSEAPEALAYSGSVMWKLEKTMKLLFLRKVFFWPRFHIQVQDSLDKTPTPISVRQIRIPMSPVMSTLQAALLDCIQESIQELKRLHRFLDPDELSVENALFGSFEHLLRMQLDPIWHRVSGHAKAVVADLNTLRRMVGYVTVYDCVSFWSLLEGVRAENAMRGVGRVDPWLMLDAADGVFRVARERVFRKVIVAGGAEIGTEIADASVVAERRNRERFGALASSALQNVPDGLEIIGEEQPKWIALRDLLPEILAARRKALSKGEVIGPILIMVHGEKTCSQLSEVLSGHIFEISNTSTPQPQPEPVTKKSRRTVSSDNEEGLNASQAASTQSQTATRRRQRGSAAVKSIRPAPSAQPATSTSEKLLSFSTPGSQALMARQISNYFYWKTSVTALEQNLSLGSSAGSGKGGSSATAGKLFGRGGSTGHVRRRARGGGAAGGATGPLVMRNFSGAMTEVGGGARGAKGTSGRGKGKPVDFDDGDEPGESKHAVNPLDAVCEKRYKDPAAPLDEAEFEAFFELVQVPRSIIIRPYATSLLAPTGGYVANGDDDARMLDLLKPSTVIMYDVDTAFVRRLEVHHAQIGGERKLNVYFMVYDNSVEEQKYLTVLRKEKDAFEKLIREKANMAIPIDQDGRVVDPEDIFWRNLDTRVAGGQIIPAAKSNQVIVDVREFRSALPSLLHSRRMKLIPVTLEVGDYVLTPSVCVERKSIPDLIGSFKSGRLYTQAEAMCLHYTTPVLLIEFAQGKAFSLNTSTGIGVDAGDDLNSKLSLLILAFPKMRVIWSSSPAATAEIFEDLKKDQPEPSPEDAMSLGIESGEPIDSVFSITPSDMIRCLPGITSKNYRNIMRRVDSIVVLAALDEDEIIRLVGDEGGRLLNEFLDSDVRRKQ